MQVIKVVILAAGISVATASGGHACSIIAKPLPYEDYIESLREPSFASLVRSAATIDLAKVILHKKTDAPESWYADDDAADDEGVFKSRYFFSVSERLKGNSSDEYEYVSQYGKENQQAIPFYRGEKAVIEPPEFNQFTRLNAAVRHRNPYFWEYGSTSVGNSISSGDCNDYVWFDVEQSYLVFRDESGAFLSAEQIDYADDIWLVAVQNLIADPTLDFGYAMDLKNFVTMQYTPSEITVTSCRKPTLKIRNLRTSRVEIEEHNYVYGDDESYRFTEFPFSKETCSAGERFYSNNGRFGQWFKIDEQDRVHLTDVAGQLEIKDERLVPLSEILSWFE